MAFKPLPAAIKLVLVALILTLVTYGSFSFITKRNHANVLKNKKQPRNQNIQTPIIPSLQSQLSYINNPNTLIDSISKSECYECERIGMGGSLSRIYAFGQRLYQISSVNQLVKYTHHKNPVVVAYAFRGLQQKDSLIAKNISYKLRKDKRPICTFSGCIKMNETVSNFVSME